MSREEAMAEMLQYFDKKAEVGIFWYHPVKEKLFEVYSIPVTLLSEGQLTYPKLHKTVWQKLHYQAKNDKKNGFPYDPIYLSDYVQVPRGRIFFRNNKFYVFVQRILYLCRKGSSRGAKSQCAKPDGISPARCRAVASRFRIWYHARRKSTAGKRNSRYG